MADQTIPSTASEPVDTSRFEQVNGKLIERPLPTLDHGQLQFHLTSILRSALAEVDLDGVQEVSINHWDEPKSDCLTPDAIVSVAGGFQKAQRVRVLPPIAVAVEVLSSRSEFLQYAPQGPLRKRSSPSSPIIIPESMVTSVPGNVPV